jgi:drug/metabolite transporter (DMT)-like permease
VTDPAGERRDNVGLGMGLALLSILIFSTQDAASKAVVESGVAPIQMTMMRFWAFAGFALLLAWRQGGVRAALQTRRPGLQILRGVLLVADVVMFAAALGMVPFVAVSAITLVYPLMVTVFAIPLLGEKVGLFRTLAVLAGFCGALVIVRPGGVPLDWGVLLALGSAACYALYLVLTRKVSEVDTPATSLLYTGLVGLVLSSAVGVFYWEPLEPRALLLVSYIMLTGVLAHGLMIYALAMAPASVLQPFNYTSLPWAVAFSILAFNEPLDSVALIGATIIVAAGLVVMARERALRSREAVAAAPLPGRE